MGLSQFDERIPFANVNVFDDATTPGGSNVADAGLGFLRVDRILVASDSVSPINVRLTLTSPYSDLVILGQIEIPAGAATTSGVPAVDLISIFTSGDLGIVIPSGFTLGVFVVDALATGENLRVATFGGYL